MRNIYRTYIRNKLFNKVMLIYISFLLVILLILGSFFCVFYQRNQRSNDVNYFVRAIDYINQYMAEQEELCEKRVFTLYVDCFDNADWLAFFQQDLPMSGLQRRECFNYLYRILNSSQDINSISLYRKSDDSLIVVNRSRSLGYTEAEVRQNLRSDLPYQGGGKPSAMASDSGIRFTLPINNYLQLASVDAEISGYLTFDISRGALDSELKKYGPDLAPIFLILQDDGMVVYDSTSAAGGRFYPHYRDIRHISGFRLEDQSYPNQTILLDNDAYCVLKNEQNPLGLEVYCLYSLASTQKQMHGIFLITVGTILLAFLVGIAAIYFTTGYFSHRIQTLISQIQHARTDHASSELFPITASDEIGEIARQFSQTFEEQQLYRKQAYEYELQQKNASYRLLQSQINPHFLFNTLEAVRMRALGEGSQDTALMIYNMAQLLRQTINTQDVSTVGKELNYIRMYLELFQMRYPDMIAYRVDLPEPLAPLGILSNLVQPVVENCIVHGFSPAIDQYAITIDLTRKGEDLLIRIRDNGKGMPSGAVTALNQDLSAASRKNVMNSIGLPNVNERIKLFYGQEYGVHIESREGCSTTVTLRLKSFTVEEVSNRVQSFNRR